MPRGRIVVLALSLTAVCTAIAAGVEAIDDGARVASGRRPKKWQIEFTLHVTWWLKNSRTRPPQTRPVTAPFHDIVSRPPSTKGTANVSTAQSGKRRETAIVSRSWRMSLA